MARTTTTMSMAKASAAMTAAWRQRRHVLWHEQRRTTSKKAIHTRRCCSTTTQTIWVDVITSPTLTARWCSISSMFLSEKCSLRSAITLGIRLIFSMRRNSMRRRDCITMNLGTEIIDQGRKLKQSGVERLTDIVIEKKSKKITKVRIKMNNVWYIYCGGVYFLLVVHLFSFS